MKNNKYNKTEISHKFSRFKIPKAALTRENKKNNAGTCASIRSIRRILRGFIEIKVARKTPIITPKNQKPCGLKMGDGEILEAIKKLKLRPKM